MDAGLPPLYARLLDDRPCFLSRLVFPLERTWCNWRFGPHRVKTVHRSPRLRLRFSLGNARLRLRRTVGSKASERQRRRSRGGGNRNLRRQQRRQPIGSGAKPQTAGAELFKSADKDADGQISAEEIAARIRVWSEGETGLMSFYCMVTLDGRALEGAEVKLDPEPFLGDGVKPASGVTAAMGQF